MECLSLEVLSEVLACLRACEIASFVLCSRDMHQRVCHMKCVSVVATKEFRKPVSIHDFQGKYRHDFFLQPLAPSTGAVTFRFPLWGYFSKLSRKLLLHALHQSGEEDAALWFATQWGLPRRPLKTFTLYRTLAWDYLLYMAVCRSFAKSPWPTLHLHIRSMAGFRESRFQRLDTSSQVFLCHILSTISNPSVFLSMHGAFQEAPPVGVSRQDLMADKSRVAEAFAAAHWPDDIVLFNQSVFRSSTVALGITLSTLHFPLQTLELTNYCFDERPPSVDVALFCKWLITDAHQLTRVSLKQVSFVHGNDFVSVLRSLCAVSRLESLRLSCVDYGTLVPEDPLSILFQQGGHLRDVRVDNLLRQYVDFPFHALPAYRCIGLTRMFLDTSHVRSLALRLSSLPELVSLDLSYNGLDGRSLELFAGVLRRGSCALQRLKLSSNIITNTSIVVFCTALQENRSLEALDLSDNFLGTQGGLAVMRGVLASPHTKLRTVGLDHNQLRLTMDDLYSTLVHCDKSSPKHISLKDNPLEFGPTPKQRDTYKHFFRDTFRISFSF